MAKTCSECWVLKDFTSFYPKPRIIKYPDSAAGFSHTCKECMELARKPNLKYSKEERAYNESLTDKEYRKNQKLKNSYGITLVQFNEMFASQEGKCACCKTHQAELKKPLCLDHRHSDGQVRGLLCFGCNIALGFVKENTKTLKNLIIYINSFSGSAVVQTNTDIKVG